MRYIVLLVAAYLFPLMAVAQDNPQTFVIARIGLRPEGQVYRLAEVLHQRGRWIFPDIWYLDFGEPGKYRELAVGGGAVLFTTKHLTIIEGVYLDVASGPESGGALYFQPWTYIDYQITARLGGEAMYFPYLPLNRAGTAQHVVERAKLEYEFTRFKIGGGYAAYQFGDGPWTHRPFVTTTLKSSWLGSLELWLQKMPSGSPQIQVRYLGIF